MSNINWSFNPLISGAELHIVAIGICATIGIAIVSIP